MKEYLVIGNPITHSLSPELHNYWMRENGINGIYDKKKLNENDLKEFFLKIRNKEINGANITVPFKRDVIPYLDQLSFESEKTQSVNTVYLKNEKIIGHNTDIDGFELAIKDVNYDVKGKKVLILGAGGVVPSVIFALYKMGVLSITISNRTKSKAEDLKNIFNKLEIVEWGETPNFDMIINATSIGLKNEDGIKLDYSQIEPNKFFYDVIYNPKETIFLKRAKLFGNRAENGKMMFIYQAHQSFTIWHKLMPEINEEVINLLD